MEFFEKLKKLFNEDPGCCQNATSHHEKCHGVTPNEPACSKQGEWVKFNKCEDKFKNSKCCDVEVKLKKCCDKLQNLFYVKGNATVTTLVVFYINVDVLPLSSVDALVAKRLEQYKGLFDRLPENVGVMVVPNRTHTHVEFLQLDVL